MLQAVYFDGASARAIRARIAIQGDTLVIADDSGVLARRPLHRVAVQPPLKNAPQRIDLGGGATLEVADKTALAAMLSAAGIVPGPIERAQRSWAIVIGALAGIVVLAWAAYAWLLPAAVGVAAGWVPARLEAAIGDEVWPMLDGHAFQPSILSADRQQALRTRFEALSRTAPEAASARLEFRSASTGPNAFTLPGGRIVLTDQLVARAGNDEAIVGVLAHELGHVAHRHTLRNLMQAAALTALLSAWLGDVSSLVAAVPATLATLKYSRDFEREADGFAIATLAAAGLSTLPLADLFEALDPDRAQAGDLWSTHPVSAERVARLRAAAR
jgi:Zn-dependent protease with chaperone function